MSTFSRTLARLAELHAHLSPLRGADSAVLKANHFDAQLDELAAITDDLKRLRGIGLELSNVRGAVDMLLELLDAAHNRKLDGGHLHCLLKPLVGKLGQAEDALDEIL
ncbi:DUF1484 family protein [Pseudomonas sp. RIT-PI-AD]|uniref:DUF1484 family protein n=1 Tax=Pseudomonas sp. RIT-PI-AD TaxID=3035294 RepID=UPI0021D7DCD3|nr:DUF1484 family protein [Pseudomonas sp. RIT-PI-AD]